LDLEVVGMAMSRDGRQREFDGAIAEHLRRGVKSEEIDIGDRERDSGLAPVLAACLRSDPGGIGATPPRIPLRGLRDSFS
jgi:hypothetical protein